MYIHIYVAMHVCTYVHTVQLDARVHQLESEWLILAFTSIKTRVFNPFTRERALCARKRTRDNQCSSRVYSRACKHACLLDVYTREFFVYKIPAVS